MSLRLVAIRARLILATLLTKTSALAVILTLCLAPPLAAQVTNRGSTSKQASVALLTVHPDRSLTFNGASVREFVVIAIADCSLILNGNPLNLKAGEHKTFLHRSTLQLGQSGSKPIPVVLVQVLSWKQELTISADTLTAHQSMEDASDRNATLLIAITPLKLADTKDLAGEGDPWISSRPRMIVLSAGLTTWLQRGIHRIKNLDDSSVQFVTIEW